MRTERIAAAVVIACCAACVRPSAPPERYAIETPGGPATTPPAFIERDVVDRDGNTWTFRGYVPNARCNAAMASKLDSFAKELRSASEPGMSDHSFARGTRSYHDVLIANRTQRRAWIWSTEWMDMPSQRFSQEIRMITVNDFDGDGCGDLVMEQPPRRIALGTSTGRLVERP